MKQNILTMLVVLVLSSLVVSCDIGNNVSVALDIKFFEFDEILPGETSEKIFVLTNKTESAITIFDTEFKGSHASQFNVLEGSAPPEIVVAASGIHNIKIEFAPEIQGGLAWAQFNIFFRNVDGESLNIIINLKGKGKQFNDIQTTPDSLYYEKTVLDENKSKTIAISNIDYLSLNITEISITGTDFEIISGWTDTPVILQKDEFFEIVISYKPQIEGFSSENLLITHDDPSKTSPLEVALTGHAIAQRIYTISAVTRGTIFTKLEGNEVSVFRGTDVDAPYDEDFVKVPIGFTFQFFTSDNAEVYIGANGFLSFDEPASMNAQNTEIASTDAPYNYIAVLWDDLIVENYGDEDMVLYETTGIAPMRVFTVEWQSLTIVSGGETTHVTFGVQLFEETNEILMYYSSDNNVLDMSATIGIENESGRNGFMDIEMLSPNVIAIPVDDMKFTPSWRTT
ncbi:MAG: choice-of-anchor D domain-containing protein, partial [Planctomycetes bacterium]|nr:choice-of-anchor D domain-containing protein [Planctomycetota bacterium]